MERFSAALASAAASVSNTFSHSRSLSTTEQTSNLTTTTTTATKTTPTATTPTAATSITTDTLMTDEVSQSPDTAPKSHSATSSPRSPRRSPNAVQQVQSEVDHILISASNTPYSLRVPPSGYGGAIPRRSVISRDSSADSTASATDATTSPLTSSTTVSKTCFCGHYTEVSKVKCKVVLKAFKWEVSLNHLSQHNPNKRTT